MHYDLHIHSALSPCADEEMTPCNVCAMARLKGLELIALTDHNSARNLRAFAQAARERELRFLPGLEVTTAEEVHLLTYFPDVERAESMGAWCREQLVGQKNRPAFFGRQLVLDSGDRILGEEDALLIGALASGLDEVCAKVRSLDGVPVPAHVNRSYGLLTVLGFFPPDAGFMAAEARPGEELPPGVLPLYSSDAHTLGAIAEPEHALPLEKGAAAGEILALLRRGLS